MKTDQDFSRINARLADSDPQRRRDAARELGEEKDPRGIPALIFALGDQNRGCQEAAMDALVKIGGREVVEQLIPLVTGRKVHLRSAALEILEQIGKDAAPYMCALLHDRIPTIRVLAVTFLGNLGLPELLSPLETMLEDEDSNVRCAALRALGATGGRKAAAMIRRYLNDPEEWVRFAAIQTLATIGDRESIPDLLSFLKHISDVSRMVAMDALGSLGSLEAVPVMLQILPDASPKMRDGTIYNLARIADLQGGDLYREYEMGRFEEHFIAALHSSHPEIRDAALKGLLQIGTVRSVLPILELIRSFREELGENQRELVQDTLVSIGDTAELIDFLESLPTPLTRGDEAVVIICGKVLGRMRDQRAAPVLARFLEKGAEPVRRAMVCALGELGGEGACAAMIAKLNDPNGHVRRDAASVLGRMRAAESILPLFAALKRETYDDVREVMLNALANMDSSPVREGFRNLLDHENVRIRETAIRGIGLTGDSSACRELFNHLQEADYRVRMRVVEALGQLDCEGGTEILVGCLSDEHEKVRLAAMEALSGHPTRTALEGIVSSLYDRNSWVAYRAAEILGRVGDPGSVKPMMDLLEETRDLAMKVVLIRALREIGDPRSRDLLEKMKDDPDPEIRKLFM